MPARPNTARRGQGQWALGYHEPLPAVDVNVRRVVSRVLLDTDASGGEVQTAAAAWLDRDDPSGWNQAVMDLGREVCRPVPRCAACPLSRSCRFRRNGSWTADRPA